LQGGTGNDAPTADNDGPFSADLVADPEIGDGSKEAANEVCMLASEI
jgi:hypothetical protein